jgi:hypothetical protein
MCHTFCNLDEDLNVFGIEVVYLVAQEPTQLLLSNVVLRQRNVLTADEAAPRGLIYIPRHICGC